MSHENMAESPVESECSVEEAIAELKRAEEHLKRAQEQTVIAEREVERAVKDLEEAEARRHQVKIHVIHVNEVEKATFHEHVTATLDQVWNKSYEELGIDRKEKDIFQTGGNHPKSLMSHLALTLEQAKDQNVIHDFHFGIASETGGA